ncbi:hypothetical protein HMY34_09835 [Thiothrix subterranea]|uniref:hypothetical protein n=1 Tax=Thiothrix subterranea TaxID=2735563 RepID=UPI00192C4D23|nr:hypothetical protein [Thiothrix subterranea]QQZ29032.1 hypothetical protein HMY34_09835 [Thiothrix subterranea]
MQRIRNAGHFLEKVGDLAVEAFHVLGLFVIGGTIVWSAAHAYLVDIMQKPFL